MQFGCGSVTSNMKGVLISYTEYSGKFDIDSYNWSTLYGDSPYGVNTRLCDLSGNYLISVSVNFHVQTFQNSRFRSLTAIDTSNSG